MTTSDKSAGQGPLAGLRILEMAGVGPGPFCAMMLADMGAEVISVDRLAPHGLGIAKEHRFNPTTRSRRSMAIDIKHPAGREAVLRLVQRADGLMEGNRPGVMERLGLGPEDCWRHNARLVYGRCTGWGQEGPLSQAVGHDLNYLALTGALSLIGPQGGPPVIPLNLLADYAGGGTYLALGMLAALIAARTSGEGQVVDAAMIDGVGSLLTHHFGFVESGRWAAERGTNFLDGGAPWYNVYQTADGGYVSVAAIEARFYHNFVHLIGLDPAELPNQLERSTWPKLKEKFAAIFATRSRDEWCAVFDDHEACFAPVLSIEEAVNHPHMKARQAHMKIEGVRHPAPAPRFSKTASRISAPPPVPGSDTEAILNDWGFDADTIEALRQANAIG